MLDLLAKICWIMTPEAIGTAYKLDSAAQTFLTVSHMFANRLIEQVTITCPLIWQDNKQQPYWIHDLGHDLAIVSNQKVLKHEHFDFSWSTPQYCYNWTLLPHDQWPWARADIGSDLVERIERIKEQTQSKFSPAAAFYARAVLHDYVSDVPASSLSVDVSEVLLHSKFQAPGKTEYYPTGFIANGYRMVLMKSEVRSYLQLGGELWTDCDGWKGASGGVVVDNKGSLLAVTTGLGSQATYFFREKSRIGVLRHRLILGE